MRTLKNNRAVTLVELLVGSTLGVLVCGMAYAAFSLFCNSLLDYAPGAQMHQLSVAITEKFARDVREACQALASDEEGIPPPASPRNVTRFYLYDTSGTYFAAYQIQKSVLQEWDPMNIHWRDCRVGEQPIRLAEGSSFELGPDRKSVRLRLTLASVYKNKNYEMTPPTRTYRCRN